MWRAGLDAVTGALFRRQRCRRLMCSGAERPMQLETCFSPAASLPKMMTVGQSRQSQLLVDLAGRYVYTCMLQFAPMLKIEVPRLKKEEFDDWNSTPANRKLMEAFWDFNNKSLHQFSPLELEALLAAYIQQDNSERHIEGSILSMAVSAACQMLSPPVEVTVPELRIPPWEVKNITFNNYLPAYGESTQKLLVAVFKILFGREAEDVVLQHQQQLDDPEPECTVLMKRCGIYGIPPLLRLYADQSFGLSYRIREKATRELSRHRRERFASFQHDEETVPLLRELLLYKERRARMGLNRPDWSIFATDQPNTYSYLVNGAKIQNIPDSDWNIAAMRIF